MDWGGPSFLEMIWLELRWLERVEANTEGEKNERLGRRSRKLLLVEASGKKGLK